MKRLRNALKLAAGALALRAIDAIARGCGIDLKAVAAEIWRREGAAPKSSTPIQFIELRSCQGCEAIRTAPPGTLPEALLCHDCGKLWVGRDEAAAYSARIKAASHAPARRH